MVSFKISKVGTRYTPKPSAHRVQAGNPLTFSPPESGSCKGNPLSNGPPQGGGGGAAAAGGGALAAGADAATDPTSLVGVVKKDENSVGHFRSSAGLDDDRLQSGEASFAVNLFGDGFSIDRCTEKGKTTPLGYEVMDLLYPYDRTSESFLRAIDGGWLPGDLLDDIPCIYVNGCVVCELRDYRDSIPSNSCDAVSSPAQNGACTEWIPTVRKVLLQPSTETIVKDVASMAEESWTYKDLLEVEAKILKAIQPPLCLDPAPAVARKAYTANFNKCKFNIGSRVLGRYRMPKDALADRRRRLSAAAKALSKTGKVSKLHQMNFDRVGDKPTSGAYMNYNGMQDPVGGLPRDGGVNTKAGVLGQLHPKLLGQLQGISGQTHPKFTNASSAVSMGGIQIPSSPLSSAPGTPATPSAMASANECPCFVGDAKLGSGSSLLGKRNGTDFATAARLDAKKQKAEQNKAENYQQHQMSQYHQYGAKQLPAQQHHPYQFIQQRSADSMSQNQISQTQQSSQETVSSSDLKAFHLLDQSHLDIKKAELEIGKPIEEIDQPKYETSSKIQHWDKAGIDVKEEPVTHERLLQSELLDDNTQNLRSFHAQHMRTPGLEQPQQWQQPGHMPIDMKAGLKDVLQDDSFIEQKRKLTQLPGTMKPGSISSTFGMQQVMGMGGMSTTAMGGSYPVPMMSSPSGSAPKSPMQGVAPAFPSPGTPGQVDPMLQSPQFSALNGRAPRRHSNSLSKIQSAPSPNSLSMAMPSPMLQSPSTGSATLSSPNIKGEQSLSMQSMQSCAPQQGLGPNNVNQGQRKPVVENQAAFLPSNHETLVNVIQRMKLLAANEKSLTPEKKDLPPPVNNGPPSFHLLAAALANDDEDCYKDSKGRRGMANSLVGGNINSRKTRCLQFLKNNPVNEGNGYPLVVRSRSRLVLYDGRGNTTVEAVIQMGDEHDDEAHQSGPPHHGLPTIANQDKADQFTAQYTALMEKEGWELVEDQVYPSMSRSAMTNAASNARAMPAGATALGNSVSHPGSSPRLLMNQQQHMPALQGPGMSPLGQMQPPSPSSSSTARMPPPANSARQIMASHLVQPGKPLQMDVAVSALAAAQQQHQQQQQQHQQQQHQHQQQQQQQQQLQHQQHQLQLQQQQNHQRSQPFLTPQFASQLAAHNNGQQVNHANQMQHLQYLHPRHHQPQQNLLQRKMMIPAMNNLGMGMGVGLPVSGGNNISGMNGVGLPVSGGSQGVGIPNLAGLGPGMNNSMGGISALSTMGQLAGMSNMGQGGTVGTIINQQLRSGLMTPSQSAALAGKRLSAGRARAAGNSPVRSTMDTLPMAGNNRMHGGPMVPMMGQPLARNGLQAIQRAPVSGMALPKVGNSAMPAGVNGQGYYMNQQQLHAQQMPTGSLGSVVGGPPSPQMSSQGLSNVSALASSAMDLQSVSRAGTLAAVTAAGQAQGRRPMIPQTPSGQSGQASQ